MERKEEQPSSARPCPIYTFDLSSYMDVSIHGPGIDSGSRCWERASPCVLSICREYDKHGRVAACIHAEECVPAPRQPDPPKKNRIDRLMEYLRQPVADPPPPRWALPQPVSSSTPVPGTVYSVDRSFSAPLGFPWTPVGSPSVGDRDRVTLRYALNVVNEARDLMSTAAGLLNEALAELLMDDVGGGSVIK